MKSLFVVSLPRSLSTALYEAALRSLSLRQPAWTSGGEILNRERVKIRRRTPRPENVRFATRESEPDVFERIEAFLTGNAESHGFGYKDVVQPFVVSEWLNRNDFNVLKVKRNVAEVAYSMINRRWHYADRAASMYSVHPWSLIEGLVRAEAVIDAMPGETVHYADAVSNHEPLHNALTALYPELQLSSIDYVDRKFIQIREKLETKRQESTLFRELLQAVDHVRSTIHIGTPSDGRTPVAESYRPSTLIGMSSSSPARPRSVWFAGSPRCRLRSEEAE